MVTLVFLYGCDAWVYNISRETLRIIDQTYKKIITDNFKIKCNRPYPILLLKYGLVSIERKAMIGYLRYKYKIISMKNGASHHCKHLVKLIKESKHVGIKMQYLG